MDNFFSVFSIQPPPKTLSPILSFEYITQACPGEIPFSSCSISTSADLFLICTLAVSSFPVDLTLIKTFFLKLLMSARRFISFKNSFLIFKKSCVPTTIELSCALISTT